jgi:hypothetical protein
MCPRCGQNAPVVYRGVVAYCTACGAPRPPLTGTALHLAGQGAKVGGLLTRVLGWLVLAGGLFVAIVVGLLAQVFVGGFAWAIAGLPLAALAVLLTVVLNRGGSALDRKGAGAERRARAQAVFALAGHRGSVTAQQVAQSLEIGLPEAEALLTDLAREHFDQIAVEVDANGAVLYHFGALPNARVRIDPEVARSPNRAEWERLEAEEAEARRAPQARVQENPRRAR